ncbi:hypothetical protein FS837_001552 [Tulasnella sp. UAMH 9824]|nr:hypothetical protein FS837_001552 [Tulasnella sp. UAMH 9824]
MFSFLFGVIPPPAAATTTTPTHSPSASFSRSSPSLPQHAADNASLQLQRRSYEATSAVERTKQLESENARLSRELAVLSSTPDTTPHPDTLNVSQLTLAHRRLSERLSFTESLLLEKTQNLETLSRKAQNSITFAEQCRAVLEKVQNNEEAAKQKAREMEKLARSVLVEKEFVERTVEEYAELVRKLERQRKASSVVMANANASASAILTPTRTTSDPSSPHSGISSIELPPGPATSSPTTHSPSQNLETGRAGLNRLLSEFNSTTEYLHQEISRLHAELEQTKIYLEVERKAGEDSQAKLATAIMELDQYKVDDKAAAKLVERYMKFSQTSIDLLQAALENQKTRSEARVATLEEDKDALRNAVTFAQSQTARLRDALDDLTEDISRESHGRRREVALRLKVVEREEHTVAELRRIARGLEDGMKAAKEGQEDLSEGALLEHVLAEVYALVDQLDAGSSSFEPSASLETEEDGVEAEGSLARVISCQEAVASLSHELQVETERRLNLEKRLADLTVGRLIVPQPEEVNVVLATPSDLGVSPDPNATLVEEQNRIAVHPLTPVVQVSRGCSPISIQQPLPVVPNRDVGPALEVDVEDGPEEAEGEVHVETPSEPVAPVVVETPSEPAVAPVVMVEPVPVVPPTLIMEVAVESPKPSPVPQLLSPIVIDTPVAGAVTPSVSSSIPVTPHSAKPTSPFSSPFAPLLVDLSQVSTRYESTSTALRNCSALLSRLKADFAGATLQLPSPPPATVPIFRSYLDRISDFLEDCRVELEIRVADEARLAKGFETMLALPLTLAGGSSDPTQMEFKIRQFVDGTDPGVAKAVESFGRKVEELEHDLALLKRAIYDAGLLEPSLSLESPSPTGAGSWSWTNLVSPGASRSRPTSPAPTFGAVMTQQRSPTMPPAHLPPSPSHSHHHLEVDQKVLDEIINLPFRISMPRPAPPPPMPSFLEPPHANGAAHKSGSSSPIAFNPRASLSSTSLNLPTPLGHNRRASALGGRPGGQFNMLRPVSSAVWSSPRAPLNGLGSSPSTPRLGMKADLGHGGSPGSGDLLKDALHHHHAAAPVVDDSSDVE